MFLSAAERLRQKIVFIIERFLFETIILYGFSELPFKRLFLFHIKMGCFIGFSGATTLSQMLLSITTLAKQFQKLDTHHLVLLC